MIKRIRTSAVETYPYHALGYRGEGSDNTINFIFDNRFMVVINLGNRWRKHRPEVNCYDMDSGECIQKTTRMTETKLALFLANIASRKNPRLS